jgi:hypothetical protein
LGISELERISEWGYIGADVPLYKQSRDWRQIVNIENSVFYSFDTIKEGNGSYMGKIILITLLFVAGCQNSPEELPIEKLSNIEIGEIIDGYWKLVFTESNNGKKFYNPGPDRIIWFGFEGEKGLMSFLKDNHDGSYDVSSYTASQEIKEQGSKKLIQYRDLGSSWALEIYLLSQKRLILRDTTGKGKSVYKRHKVK